MGCYVLGFQEIGQTQVAVVGGKGAHLGELSRIEGIRDGQRIRVHGTDRYVEILP
jgi:phosphoenolpyruvate synthase/pyruvate phosphate dikinase